MWEFLTALPGNPQLPTMLRESLLMFLKLFTELSVLFLIISFGVALLNQRLPAERIQQLLGDKKGRGYITAAALGAITPFCSCSTIPMLIGLLKARAGFGPTMTFLFTSPLLNPIVIALFIPILGLEVTLWYATLALSISIIAGVLLQHFRFDRFIRPEMITERAQTAQSEISACSAPKVNETSCCDSLNAQDACCRPAVTDCCEKGAADSKATEAQACCATTAGCCTEPRSERKAQWEAAADESWALFKSMFPYMLIAMVIGSLVHGFIPADFFAQIAGADNPAAIPAAALIGIPLYVRVTALLPLAGSFVAKGVSMGAIIALVVGSGGASLPELILLKRLFYWPLLLAFLGVTFFMAVIGGYGINLLNL
ncbi:permease [Reinekea marinisedimentorum]|uniref:Permease n=1 Tax=Reinekea marinisedimentorum TaxID=230495 RepID=A0A4R3I5A7_9GAMM|nr:permease [Reinekea marinisedimentorum]TCS41143.1 hypothetical protein BCF53_107158 [Reinekea marinisedimentorum]